MRTRELVFIMERYFGESGIVILKREMKRIGIKNLKDADDYKKIELVRNLSNIFAEVLSVRKVQVIKSRLLSIFGLTSRKYDSMFLSSRDW